MWTMTQGHEPHGDGGGREELLIRACGISYGYHRTDSVLPPMAATQPPRGRHCSLRHQSASLLPTENGVKVWIQSEPRVKFTRERTPWGVTRHKLTINEFLKLFYQS